jgi:hypothetical protein
VSTSYIPITKKDGKIEFATIDEKVFRKDLKSMGFKLDKEDKQSFCVTDGDSFLWVYYNDEKQITGFERFGMNNVGKMIDRIDSQYAEIRIISEHDDEFDTLMESVADEDDDS